MTKGKREYPPKDAERLTLEDQEMAKYRRHVDSLLEPRRQKIRKDAKHSAISCVAFCIALLLVVRNVRPHTYKWLVTPLFIGFALSVCVLLFTLADMLMDRLTKKI